MGHGRISSRHWTVPVSQVEMCAVEHFQLRDPYPHTRISAYRLIGNWTFRSGDHSPTVSQHWGKLIMLLLNKYAEKSIYLIYEYLREESPAHFRLAATVLWRWSWEKDGTAVEVVPAFRLYRYIGSFVFHVHSYQDQFIQPGWAECVLFSLGLHFVCLYCFNLFVCPQSTSFCVSMGAVASPLQVLALA